MIDLHVHSGYGRCSEGSMYQYVDSAKAKGVDVLGFVEHTPLPQSVRENYRRFDIGSNTFSQYADRVRILKAGKNPLKILAGVEAEFIPDDKSLEVLKQIPGLDFLIGSVHFVGENLIDDINEGLDPIIERYQGDIKRIISDYFALVSKMISTHDYQIVGHLDVIGKTDGKYFNEANGWYSDYVKGILEEIKDSGMALEVNTSGFDHPIGRQYPAEWIIKESKKMGIPATMGSDAHRPEQVARHFEQAKEILRKAEHKKLAIFRDKHLSLVDLA